MLSWCCDRMLAPSSLGRTIDEVAVLLGHVEVAVGPRRRALADGAEADLPLLLTGLRVERREVRRVVDDVEPAVVDQRRREARLVPVRAPQLLGLGHVAAAGAVDRHHAALRRLVEVLLAVRHVDHVAVDHRRHVERVLRQPELPHLLAGARLQRVEPAVGRGRRGSAAGRRSPRPPGSTGCSCRRAPGSASRSRPARRCACRTRSSGGAADRAVPSSSRSCSGPRGPRRSAAMRVRPP